MALKIIKQCKIDENGTEIPETVWFLVYDGEYVIFGCATIEEALNFVADEERKPSRASRSKP